MYKTLKGWYCVVSFEHVARRVWRYTVRILGPAEIITSTATNFRDAQDAAFRVVATH